MALLALAFTWSDNSARTLIRRRRHYHNTFNITPQQRQRRLWRQISLEIFNENPTNARPSTDQCRNKWNALKSGYENLRRLINGNPYGYPTHTPTLHDELLFYELSDEFWLIERNYLLLFN
jgi:hypothetical protein